MLRYFQTYDKNGVDSEKSLQEWSGLLAEWIDVPFIRVPEYLEEKYRHDDPSEEYPSK